MALERKKVETDYETRWIVIGTRGAVDFHCSNVSIGHGFGRMGGVEEHHRVPPEYIRDKKPSFTDCQVLGGNCWCDGSSLYASEFMIPMLERCGEEAIWRQLEMEYTERFPEVAALDRSQEAKH